MKAIHVRHNTTFKISGINRRYRFGSVVGYALEYNLDPIQAYERELNRGHSTHWINPESAVLLGNGYPRRGYSGDLELTLGDTVQFEGRLFILAPASNHNLKLIPTTGEDQ